MRWPTRGSPCTRTTDSAGPPPRLPGSDRLGVHSKRAVIDDDTVVIGTYNVDPRSANLNAELLVVCQGGTALATQMHEDLMSRMLGPEP